MEGGQFGGEGKGGGGLFNNSVEGGGWVRGKENDGRQLQSALISMIMICH